MLEHIRPATPLFLPPTCYRQAHGGNPNTMPVSLGKHSRALPFVRQRLPRPTRQAASHADLAPDRLRHHRPWLSQIILSIPNKNKDSRQSTTHGSRLSRRTVHQLHLTPPTSSPHGIPSPTPTVTVASTNASLPLSSLSSASVNTRYQASRHREQHTFSQGQRIRWMEKFRHRQTLWRPWIKKRSVEGISSKKVVFLWQFYND